MRTRYSTPRHERSDEYREQAAFWGLEAVLEILPGPRGASEEDWYAVEDAFRAWRAASGADFLYHHKQQQALMAGTLDRMHSTDRAWAIQKVELHRAAFDARERARGAVDLRREYLVLFTVAPKIPSGDRRWKAPEAA
jgi:hypothetical protein